MKQDLSSKVIIMFAFFIFVLTACGGGGGGGTAETTSSGGGWVDIDSPVFSIQDSSAYLGGEAFISKDYYRCCSGSADDSGVTVTWENKTNGSSGIADHRVTYDYLFGVPFISKHYWSADIPLVMGQNSITVKAYDPGGKFGTATATITRIPDTTPPTVKSTNPLNNATGVAIDTIIAVAFNEDIDPSTLNSTSFIVKDSGNNQISGVINCCTDKKAQFTPNTSLASATLYSCTVSRGVKDLVGNIMAADYSWTFATGSNYWQPTSTLNAPYLTSSLGVWTGTECIFWGTDFWNSGLGGRYSPVTDAWKTMSPTDVIGNYAVWTGTEMLVWDGVNTVGRRYNPVADSWTPISTINAPPSRWWATAIWTGTEMIIWGGLSSGETSTNLNSGARYNPSTDSWQLTSLAGAPAQRSGHVAVWTGTDMIIWGGIGSVSLFNDGGKYNPTTDLWEPINVDYAPKARQNSSAVWTGSEMIIWGGSVGQSGMDMTGYTNTGARYNPVTKIWKATSTENAPIARAGHSALWTGAEMIIWDDGIGSRYNPVLDRWSGITTVSAPTEGRTKLWTGSEMIIYYGNTGSGGRYIP